MQSTSERFQKAIRTSGQRKTMVNVTDSFGSALIFENIPVIEGQIVVDRNSEIRRSGSISIGDETLTPALNESHAGAFSVEIHVYHGVVYPDGSEELIKMGIFNIDSLSWDASGYPVLQINDRSKFLQRDPLVSPRDYSGKLVKSVINEVVAETIPGVDVEFEDGLDNPRLPGGSVFEGARTEILQRCCELMGAEWFFDVNGSLQVVEVPDSTATDAAVVWELNVGEGFIELQGDEGDEHLVTSPQGIMTSFNRTVGREGTWNAVVVYGAAPDSNTAQPYALAYDNDPNSPTYYNGPFGKSTKRVDNQLLTSVAQCTEAAVAELKNNLGLSRATDFGAIGNPALDVGEHILLSFLDGSQEVHLLDNYSYPLGPGEFTGNTRTNPARQTSSVAIKKGKFLLETPPGPPGKPQLLDVANTTITVKWSASRAGSSALKSYEIFLNDSLKKTVSYRDQETTLTGLATGTTYVISVRAIDQAGNESKVSAKTITKTSGPPGGSATTPANFTQVWTANWSKSYTYSGAPANWLGTDLYQGVHSDGSGNYRALIGFNDEKIRAELQGVDVHSCQVWLYFTYWKKSTGGTAIFGTHNYDNRPSTWNNANVLQDRDRSSGWPKPGGRWVNLGEVIGENFRTGSAKGISLGPAPSAHATYCGRALGVGSGDRTPVLRIKGFKD